MLFSNENNWTQKMKSFSIFTGLLSLWKEIKVDNNMLINYVCKVYYLNNNYMGNNITVKRDF